MKTILVATDFSASALNAAKYALALGEQLHASKMILYHRFEPMPPHYRIPVAMGVSVDSHYEDSVAMLENTKTALQSLTSSIDIICKIDNLDLLEGIERLNETDLIELVVVGKTGKTKLDQLLLGSNTARLCKTCRLPLLVVPSSTVFIPIKKMVLACDFKEVAETVPVHFIKMLNKSLNAELLVVHVDHHEEEHYDPHMITEQYALYDLLDDLNPVYHYVDNPSERKGIIMFTDEQQAQLVLVVMKEQDIIKRIFGASVSKEVALSTSIPALLIRSITPRRISD